MNKRKWIALILAGGLAASLMGNMIVLGSDAVISDDPGGDDILDDDLIDDYPDDWDDVDWDDVDSDDVDEPADTPDTEPVADTPATETPATSAPATEAPVYVPETQAWTEPYYDPSQYTYISSEENYEDEDYDSSEEEGIDNGIEDNGLTINDFLILDEEDAREAFDLPDASELPPQMYLRVPDLLQEPELPTGCEATALTMVLQYEKFDIDKETLAYTYQIYNREDDNMAIGYVGSPFEEDGAGCFAPAMVATAEHFFQALEVPYHAYDITDTEMQELYAYLAAGAPVIVWTTMDMEEPEFTEDRGEFNEREYPWYRQEHCVVLTGYNLDEGTVQVNDPLDGVLTRNIEEFTDIYQKTGMNAIVVKAYEDYDPSVYTSDDSGEDTSDEVSDDGSADDGSADSSDDGSQDFAE